MLTAFKAWQAAYQHHVCEAVLAVALPSCQLSHCTKPILSLASPFNQVYRTARRISSFYKTRGLPKGQQVAWQACVTQGKPNSTPQCYCSLLVVTLLPQQLLLLATSYSCSFGSSLPGATCSSTEAACQDIMAACQAPPAVQQQSLLTCVSCTASVPHHVTVTVTAPSWRWKVDGVEHPATHILCGAHAST